MTLRYRHPRRQAERLAGLAAREGASFRGVILGRRKEGKTDLLEQVRAELFSRAEGPVPFLYSFEATWGGAADGSTIARHCFASFCQQVRAFLMRQEELLHEPTALIERELERPGIPLSLSELAQNFLSLPPDQQIRFVAGLPAQLAYLERRPVCWLLDDVDRLGMDSPILAALDGKGFSWVLAGRRPFLRRLAGEFAWPVIPLESFSAQETSALAEQLCREAEQTFVPQAWESWLSAVGPSPWLIQSVLDAAAAHGDSLNALEGLGRVYGRELATGTFGNWLARRFDDALPDHRDRLAVARFLRGLAGKGRAEDAPLLPVRVWKGLIQEEWADETPLGPRWSLQTVEWDWVWLVTGTLAGSVRRAEARALQTLLARAEPDWRVRQTANLLASIHQRILDLPQRGFPPAGEQGQDHLGSLDICSVCPESSGAAQLFWCYGFRDGRRDVQEAASVLLIALCAEEPAPAEIEAWKRELQNEERLLPGVAAGRQPCEQGAAGRSELWLVLPAMALPAAVAPARRFSLETFARWLEAGEQKKS